VELPEWKSITELGHIFGVVEACDIAEAEEGVGEAVLSMISYKFFRWRFCRAHNGV
jgi:hypothetical protein